MIDLDNSLNIPVNVYVGTVDFKFWICDIQKLTRPYILESTFGNIINIVKTFL